VPARAGVLIIAALSALSAIGFDRLLLTPAMARVRRLALGGVVLALIVEGWTTIPLTTVQTRPSQYSQWLRQQTGEIVAESPMALPDALPGRDADVEYESIFHWTPTVNGYSGYYPRSYVALLEACRAWGSGCRDALSRSGVTLLVVHDNWQSPRLDGIDIHHVEADVSVPGVLTARSLTGRVRVYRLGTPQATPP
jgi:hypothetical protein